MRRRKAKNNLEIYFVIYLSAIISFFAVETQVRIYKRSQDNLILESSRDKLKDLIKIDKYGSEDKYVVWDDSFNKLSLDLSISGDFEFSSAIFIARFSYADTVLQKKDFDFPLLIDDNDKEHYYLQVNEEEFGEYRSTPKNLSIICNFKPSFSTETRQQWANKFDSKKIADKIIKKILKSGTQTISKEIAASLVPKFVQTQFDVTFDKDSESVLRGVEWSIPINIGGVYENKDFSIDVIEGKSLFSELIKDRPRSYLKGMGSSNGNIQISAIRLGDGKTRTASVEIRAYDPQYESNNDNIEIYVDEDFDFDARIKEVESSRISATVSDNITNITSDYKTANFTLGPYKTNGEVQVKIKVDGKRVNLLDRKIIIKKPPPPSIEVIEKTLSTIQFKVITYGKNNELKYEFPEKGLISLNRLPEVVKPQQNIKEYQLRGSIRPPQASEGSQIEIEFFVTDKYGKRTEFSRTYVIQ